MKNPIIDRLDKEIANFKRIANILKELNEELVKEMINND